MSTLTDEQIAQLDEWIDDAVELNRAYVEEHADAADAYSHMPRESWTTTDEHRLREWLEKQHDISLSDESDINPLVEYILDNFEMQPRHMFSTTPARFFCVASYAVQEFDTYLPYEDATAHMLHPISKPEMEQTCWDIHDNGDRIGCTVYAPSDVLWNAEISIDDVKSYLEDTNNA